MMITGRKLRQNSVKECSTRIRRQSLAVLPPRIVWIVSPRTEGTRELCHNAFNQVNIALVTILFKLLEARAIS